MKGTACNPANYQHREEKETKKKRKRDERRDTHACAQICVGQTVAGPPYDAQLAEAMSQQWSVLKVLQVLEAQSTGFSGGPAMRPPSAWQQPQPLRGRG